MTITRLVDTDWAIHWFRSVGADLSSGHTRTLISKMLRAPIKLVTIESAAAGAPTPRETVKLLDTRLRMAGVGYALEVVADELVFRARRTR